MGNKRRLTPMNDAAQETMPIPVSLAPHGTSHPCLYNSQSRSLKSMALLSSVSNWSSMEEERRESLDGGVSGVTLLSLVFLLSAYAIVDGACVWVWSLRDDGRIGAKGLGLMRSIHLVVENLVCTVI